MSIWLLGVWWWLEGWVYASVKAFPHRVSMRDVPLWAAALPEHGCICSSFLCWQKWISSAKDPLWVRPQHLSLPIRWHAKLALCAKDSTCSSLLPALLRISFPSFQSKLDRGKKDLGYLPRSWEFWSSQRKRSQVGRASLQPAFIFSLFIFSLCPRNRKNTFAQPATRK